MQTPCPLQEIRLLFASSEHDRFCVSLTNGDGEPIGVEQPFSPFLTDADYENLRWYLEEYLELPDGGAVIRAATIEAKLAAWGRRLHDAIFSASANRAALEQLLAAPEPRELTVGSSDASLLRLPWELMADAAGKLALRVALRRQPDVPVPTVARATKPPLRILYLVSRPEDAGFIDPRMTTKGLLAAIDPLGEAVQLDFCRPPTLARLAEVLRAAQQAGKDYEVVHFDGHGTFLPEMQVGALCFEKSDDGSGDSLTDLVAADRLGDLLAEYRIPLVVLAACRSATVGKTLAFRSVAPRLLQAGVGSVLSMGHAVHVEAARIFLDAFYRELASGTPIGHAVAQGRSALVASPARWLESGPAARTVQLEDWFLPQLYQRGHDDPLLSADLAGQQSLRQYDIFLSHNHNDSGRVEGLARTLSEKHGLRVWLDKWECGPGKLEAQCAAGIRNSRFTVVAGSQSALDSKWVDWEIKKHLELDPDADRLLPLKFESLQLPQHLKDQLWIDFINPAQDAANSALLAGLIRSTDAADARRRRGFRPPARQRDEHGPFPPPPAYGFHGRARELLALERALRNPRSQRGIVLHAMGGMGKTALASEAAEWWTRSGLFRDGACFVSFEQCTSAERAVQVFGCYVAGEQFNQLPPSEQRRRAIEFIQEKAVLLVWDNFESTLPQFNDNASPYTDDERRRLAELFADLTRGPGRGALLVTGRPGETGLPGAHRHELFGLARADSLWLLAGILQRHDLKLSDPRLSRERLDPLLDDLSDHPLSIELVGPHLKTLTPDAIRADFAQLLAGFEQQAPAAADGGEGLNSSLLASLEFSRRHLSAAARAALPWLGLFRGGVFEAILLDVSQIRPEDWQPIRDELQGSALVRVEDEIQITNRPFLRFHPTLAAAVADPRLAQQPETRRRFIVVYGILTLALNKALHGSQPRTALAILDREEGNYRNAVRWAIRDGRNGEATELGAFLSRYLARSGRPGERDAWVTMLRDVTQEGALTQGAAELQMHAATTRFEQGDPHGAIGQLRALVELLRSTTHFDHIPSLACALRELGAMLRQAGTSSQAIPILREAVVLWEALVERETCQTWKALLTTGRHVHAGNRLQNLSATLGDLANALSDTGQHEEALVVAGTCLGIAEAGGDQHSVATSHAQYACILTDAGRYEEADARYDLALAAARDAGDQNLEGVTLQNQGLLAVYRDQLTRAIDLYRRALKRFQVTCNQAGMMETYNLMGIVEQEAGRLPEARAWYEKSRQLAAALSDQRSLGCAAQNLGIVCQHEGEAARAQGDEAAARRRFAAALASVKESLRIRQALGNPLDEAASLGQLAIIHLHLGDLTAAERHADGARQIRESLGLNDVWKDYGILSIIAAARKDPAAADWAQKRDAKLAEVERLASGGGVPSQMLQALQALSVACAQAGFGNRSLDRDAAEALGTLDGYPPPFPVYSAALRQLAAGQFPAIPGALPSELQQILATIVEAIRRPTPS